MILSVTHSPQSICTKFTSSWNYLWNGWSYALQICDSQGPVHTNKSPLKILVKREPGHIHGLPQFLGTRNYLRNG